MRETLVDCVLASTRLAPGELPRNLICAENEATHNSANLGLLACTHPTPYTPLPTISCARHSHQAGLQGCGALDCR